MTENRWSVERGAADRGSQAAESGYPHRLWGPGERVGREPIGWLTNAQADEMDRLIAAGALVESLTGDPTVGELQRAARSCGPTLDLAVESVDPLPPGVHRAPDGRCWLLVEDIFSGTPDGWEWENVVSWDGVGDRSVPLPEPIMVQVRPVAPEPELIDTLDAFDRVLPDGRVIVHVGRSPRGRWYSVTPEPAMSIPVYVETVAVLPETGEEG